jgi:ornithine--oxo-acid transaminase
VPVSMSCDPSTTNGFGPQVPGFIKASEIFRLLLQRLTHMQVPFNDPLLLQKAIELYGDRLACFIVEPIQGEAGVVVPDSGYLATAAELCKKVRVWQMFGFRVQ